MTFQTSAMGAETSTGGVRVNIIPKEGGNDFRGDTFFGTIPNRHFSSSNLDENIIKRGLTTQPTLLVARDFNQSIGGPVAKDRIWFFGTYRYVLSNNAVAGAFYADGRQAVDDNTLKQGLGPRDVAGERESQALVLLRADEEIPRARRPGGRHRRTGGQPPPARALFEPAGQVDGNADATAAARDRVREELTSSTSCTRRR